MKTLTWDRKEVKLVQKGKGNRKDRVTVAVTSKSYSQLAKLLDENCSKAGTLSVHVELLPELQKLAQYQSSTESDGVIRVSDGFVHINLDSKRSPDVITYVVDGTDELVIEVKRSKPVVGA